MEQRGRCKTCGTFEWQWPEEGAGADIAIDAYVCYGCEAIENEVERRSDDTVHHGLKLGFFYSGE